MAGRVGQIEPREQPLFYFSFSCCIRFLVWRDTTSLFSGANSRGLKYGLKRFFRDSEDFGSIHKTLDLQGV
jgi:hypothetical protein